MTIEFKNKTRRSKGEIAERCQAVGMALIIEGEIETVMFHNLLMGWAVPTHKAIQVPLPTTQQRLHILAHEVGHIVLKHDNRTPVHRKEYEAEQFAHAALRRHGLAVSKRVSDGGKEYVASKVRQALYNRAKRIDRDTFQWCKKKLLCDDRKKISDVTLVDMS